MTINLSVPNTQDHVKPRITVIGVGGAGGNAVNNMISSQLEGSPAHARGDLEAFS